MTDDHYAEYTCPYPACAEVWATPERLETGSLLINPCCGHASLITDTGLLRFDPTMLYAYDHPPTAVQAAAKAEAMASITIREAMSALQFHGDTSPYWPPLNMLDAAVYGTAVRFAGERNADALRELNGEHHGMVMAAILAVNFDTGRQALHGIASAKSAASN